MTIDHVESAAVADAALVTVPFAFDPRALNRAVLVVVSTCHPTNGLTGGQVQSVTFDGLNPSVSNSTRSPNSPPARIEQHLFLGVPLSGDVAVTLANPMNTVVHVVGLRGVDAPGFQDRDTDGNNGNAASVSLIEIGYLAIMGISNTSTTSSAPQTVTGGLPAGFEVLAEATAGSGLGSVRGTVASSLGPAGQIIATLSGVNDWATTGLSVLGGLDDMSPAPEPIAEPREPHSPYFKHEMRARTGIDFDRRPAR